MRPIVLFPLLLAACTSTEPPESPPAIAGTPSPIAAEPQEIAAPPTPAQSAPAETTRDAIDAPRPVVDADAKCSEATKLWAAGADEMAAGRRDAARDRWVQLLRDFPSCPEVPHVFLGLADDFFAKGELESAKKTYEKVLQYPDPELRAYARYKKAWCELDLGQGESALGSFVAVAKEAAGSSDPRLARLRDVALRDSLIAFVDVGKPERARDFYRHLAGAGADDLLARLAQHYEQRGDAAAAAAVRP